MRKFWLAAAAACVLAIAAPRAGIAACGDGRVDSGEDCDNGGFCFGSSNAGAACTASASCPGGECRAVGGDGCAANCTTERDVPYNLVPGVQQGSGLKAGTSGVVANSFISLPIPLSGGLVLTIGKEREGQVPVVVKADSWKSPAVEVMGLACGCVHGAEAKTCGGNFLKKDGTPATDCTSDAGKCNGDLPCSYVHGPGNTASGVIGCQGLSGTDLDYTVDAGGETGEVGDPQITESGMGGPGSISLLTTVGVDVVLGKCSGTSPEYGPDKLFCTDDDQSDIGVSATNPAVSGVASATVRNLPDGSDIGPYEVSGKPFNCSQLALGNPEGAEIVSAFAIPEVPTIGPIAVTVDFVAQKNDVASSCGGDCGGDGEVTVDEIVTMVNVALETAQVSACVAGDTGGDGTITVDEIVAAVNNALNGCPQ